MARKIGGRDGVSEDLEGRRCFWLVGKLGEKNGGTTAVVKAERMPGNGNRELGVTEVKRSSGARKRSRSS